MASVILHKFIERIRGPFGDIVVKKMNGRLFIARPPDVTNRPPPTEAQTETSQRFALASAYAKGALLHPESRLFYEQAAEVRQQPVFSVAAGDFLNPPSFGLIGLGAYRGLAGDTVTILPTDDVAVVAVHVAIRTATGTLIEQGPASNVTGPWVYTATTTLATGRFFVGNAPRPPGSYERQRVDAGSNPNHFTGADPRPSQDRGSGSVCPRFASCAKFV